MGSSEEGSIHQDRADPIGADPPRFCRADGRVRRDHREHRHQPATLESLRRSRQYGPAPGRPDQGPGGRSEDLTAVRRRGVRQGGRAPRPRAAQARDACGSAATRSSPRFRSSSSLVRRRSTQLDTSRNVRNSSTVSRTRSTSCKPHYDNLRARSCGRGAILTNDGVSDALRSAARRRARDLATGLESVATRSSAGQRGLERLQKSEQKSRRITIVLAVRRRDARPA